jgi:Uma2 family endonuclease
VAVDIARRLLTVTEYEQLIRAGVFHEDERLELIHGELVAMSPIGVKHVRCVAWLTTILARQVPASELVSTQSPLRLADSEPQPDLAILRPRADKYLTNLPRPEDVRLLIEVADTSAYYDRATKLPLYAQAQIAEVWLVNLPELCVEVYREPHGDVYESKVTLRSGSTLSPLAFPGIVLSVAEILGA